MATTNVESDDRSVRPAARVLLIGASRGLGLALAAEWVGRGWHVTGTVRGSHRTGLHDLADDNADRIEIESLDITDARQITTLHDRLAGKRFDLLFVNAGVATQRAGIVDITTEEFMRVMVTNALGPLRVVEHLGDLVEPTGTIGVMSSGQGSVTNNHGGGDDVYRASKAALNTLMRSYDARHRGEQRTLILMAPGWVRTDLGGPDARLEIGDSIPNVVATIDSLHTTRGLHYVTYLGETVPW